MLTEQEVRARLSHALADLLDQTVRIEARHRLAGRKGAGLEPDYVVHLGRTNLAIAWKASGSPDAVRRALPAIQAWQRKAKARRTSVLAVPWMSPGGRVECERAGQNWLDLAGNARLRTPGIVVRVDGRTPAPLPRGRPRSALAPKSSRIARLLLESGRPMTQRELSQKAGLNEGFTSRVVRRLVDTALLARSASGDVTVPDTWKLAEAWREARRPHSLVRLQGHVDARTGEEVLRKVSAGLAGHRHRHAATGLAAAWQHTRFAGFRLVTLYVDPAPTAAWLADIGFVEGSAGSNVWLLVPEDDSVWAAVSGVHGVPCVSPLQAWLDLKEMPERSDEAAQSLVPLIEKTWNGRG